METVILTFLHCLSWNRPVKVLETQLCCKTWQPCSSKTIHVYLACTVLQFQHEKLAEFHWQETKKHPRRSPDEWIDVSFLMYMLLFFTYLFLRWTCEVRFPSQASYLPCTAIACWESEMFTDWGLFLMISHTCTSAAVLINTLRRFVASNQKQCHLWNPSL